MTINMTDVTVRVKVKLLYTGSTAEANMCLVVTAYYMIFHQVLINGTWCYAASPKISVKEKFS